MTVESEIKRLVEMAQRLPEAIGKDLESFGGVLKCTVCGYTSPLKQGQAGKYISRGWPVCCNLTMRWWTQRQIDNKEMPE